MVFACNGATTWAGPPPAHLPRWLLLRILAYRIQAAALGGLDKETLRVIRQPKGQTLGSSCDRPFAARIPATREGTQLRTFEQEHRRPCCTDGARKRGDANFAWVYAIRT